MKAILILSALIVLAGCTQNPPPIAQEAKKATAEPVSVSTPVVKKPKEATPPPIVGTTPAPKPGTPASYVGTWECAQINEDGSHELRTFEADGTGVGQVLKANGNIEGHDAFHWSSDKKGMDLTSDDLPALGKVHISAVMAPDLSHWTANMAGKPVQWNRVK
ncbi:MAG: hypothetical protein QM758_01300 [Armatimonas sp.]